jgi:hypothetical protein
METHSPRTFDGSPAADNFLLGEHGPSGEGTIRSVALVNPAACIVRG